jgi:hypothetical protein
LRQLAEGAPLLAALERFGPLYMANIRRRWLWRLGLESLGEERDAMLVATCEAAMSESGEAPELFFARHRFGRAADGTMAEALQGYHPSGDPVEQDGAVPSLVIDEVERVWSLIAERDDWQPLTDKVAAIRRWGAELGPSPTPAGHR